MAAERPLSGSRRATRVLPDGVTGEPILGPVVAGGEAVLGWGASLQAARNRAAVASAIRERRIVAKLGRAMGGVR
jgi:hypothetical protein